MSAPSQGTKISRSAHPAFAQPLRLRSLNMSNTQRNHTITAAIQMKIQKVHRRTSQKSFVIVSISHSFVRVRRHPVHRLRDGSVRAGTPRGLDQTLGTSLLASAAVCIARSG
jgi:hypothetical protein